MLYKSPQIISSLFIKIRGTGQFSGRNSNTKVKGKSMWQLFKVF